MAFPSRQAAVVGVYTTKQAKAMDRTSVSLQLEAIRGALADAGLDHRTVDGLIPIDMKPEPDSHSAHMYWAEQLGGLQLTYLDIGQGVAGVAKAAAAIGTGLCKVAVVFWGCAGRRLGPRGVARPDHAPRVAEWGWEIAGAYMTTWYALWAQRYMHEFKATSEDLARVAVIARDYAVDNPESVMGGKGPITVADVVNSRMVNDPLHLLDCSIENDGGYALVIASADIARDCRKKPAWVLGGAEATHTDVYRTIQQPWFPETGASVRTCADLTFRMAGVDRSDMDTAQLYDCFTITMLRNLEEMGFCELGEGADYVKSGGTRLGGAMPSNTDGGLLSNSHNANPSGMQAIELVRQLRGECGARQVRDAEIGVALAQGLSVHGQASAVILSTR